MQTYCSCCLHLVLQNESVSGPYFLYNSLTFFCTCRECEISVLALPNGENSSLIFVWNVLDRKTPCLKRISPHVQVGIQFTFIVINPRVSQATWTIHTSQVGCHRFIMTENFDCVHDVGVFWSARTTGLGNRDKFPNKWVSMVILEESSLVSLLSTLHYFLYFLFY